MILEYNLDETHERDLLARVKNDPEAFRSLYRHYFPRVYAYVAQRVGGAAEAEDVAAEIFLKVVSALNSFEYRGPGSFAAWLFRIALNQVNQFYRQQRQSGESLSLDALPDIHSDAPGPEHLLARKEMFTRLRALIATLPPRRQEIVRLKFYGGLRNQEIAAVLDLDERTVASNLSRALKDLERRYQPEIEDL